MCKRLIDGLNWEQIPDHEPSYFDQHITSLHNYAKLAIIYKGINKQRFQRLGWHFPGMSDWSLFSRRNRSPIALLGSPPPDLKSIGPLPRPVVLAVNSSVVIGRLAERDDLSGIRGLLRLEGDLGDAAGFSECERGWGFTAQGTGELGEQVGLGLQRERAHEAGRRR